MSANGTPRSADIVPIADRLRYMDAFRVSLVAAVGLIVALAPESLTTPAVQLLAALGAYAGVACLARAVSSMWSRMEVRAFSGMLIVDGLFLAWAGYATGAAESPLRYVMVLHLIAVALLASYRTSLKIALWHSMLMITVFYCQEGGALDAVPGAGIGIGSEFSRLLEFTGFFWVVAIATSSFSAVNERELRRRRYETEALATMATRLESVTAPVDAAATLVDALADSFDFERVLLIGSRDGRSPSVLASHGEIADIRPVEFDPSTSALAYACEGRGHVLASELDSGADTWLDSVLPGATNLLAVPLRAEGASFGVLVAVQGKRVGTRIARRVISMAERFVSHGTLALRNAWLLEQVSAMASTDGLTGISNRSSFDSALDAELSRAARRREDVSLLILDIDHFKRLNDEYGHQVGDDVLRSVGAALHETCREFDTAARYGGEEFAVVLPATTKNDAIHVAERFRQAIAAIDDGPSITVSVGVATFPLDATEGEALIGAADKALYTSKRAGRDRVTAAVGGILAGPPA